MASKSTAYEQARKAAGEQGRPMTVWRTGPPGPGTFGVAVHQVGDEHRRGFFARVMPDGSTGPYPEKTPGLSSPIDDLTLEDERAALANPSTRRLVFEVLSLAEDRDPVDAAADVLTAASLLASRLARAQTAQRSAELGIDVGPSIRGTLGPGRPAG